MIIIMSLEVMYFKDNGILDKERVVMYVNEDCDLGHYLLAKSHIEEDISKFSSKISDVLWFPDRYVKKGDKIIVYTKKGISNTTVNDNQTISHFFYWGLDCPLNSNNNNTCVVLFNASWIVERVPFHEGN